MCNYCGTKLKKDGYCVKCGEEICNDCASASNSKVHAKHEINTIKSSPEPKVIPYPCGYKPP